MFIPNNKGRLFKRAGYNKFGEETFSTAVEIPCSVVKLQGTLVKSPIRTDSSASRGNADEIISSAVILFPTYVTRPVIGDKFEIAEMTLRVLSVEPRYSTIGTLDHIECAFEALPQK
jgi:hypothetical protein